MGDCVICKNGKTHPGAHTLTLERSGAVVVVRGVPAEVCDNCGEAYVSGTVADVALQIAERAIAAGARVQVSDYAAA